jgi:hypothetical protein
MPFDAGPIGSAGGILALKPALAVSSLTASWARLRRRGFEVVDEDESEEQGRIRRFSETK